MPIYPLPQFEADLKADLAEQDRLAYEALKVPKTLVVRFGSMKMIGEFLHTGSAKPGCGSKLVVRTFRGVELGEMLTSTCPNSGCSKSVSRQEMLQYIDNSGGSEYPFYTEGKVIRVATPEDLDRQALLEQSKHELRAQARVVADRLAITNAKIVEVEPILGGETMTVFYSSEEKLELRDLARELGQLFRTRVELRGVGARDEARLTADYEKCGQYCCCKNFLKVLKPVSMKSAKVQKATLDPLKISGRCGRLMCCLRYEDQTYDELAKRLPRRKTRVGTPEGDGVVLDGQILTQLVLVLLDAPGDDGKDRQIAVAVEDITPPKSEQPEPRPVREERPRRETPPDRGPRRDATRGERGSMPTPPPAPRETSRPVPPQSAPPSKRPPAREADEIDDLLGGDLLGDDPLLGGGGGGGGGRNRPRGPRDDRSGPRGGGGGGGSGGGGRPRRPGPPSGPRP